MTPQVHRASSRTNALLSRAARGFQGIQGRVIISGFIKALQLSLGIAASLILARLLGASGYGSYSFALAVATLLANPSQLGWSMLLTREVARYGHEGSLGKLRGVLRTSAVWTLLASLLFSAFGFLLGGWVSDNHEGHDEFALMAGSLLVPLIAWIGLRGAALRGLDRVLIAQLLDGVFRPLFFLLLVTVAFFFGGVTAGTSIAMQGLALIVSVALGAWAIKRALPAGFRESVADSSDSVLWRRSLAPFIFLYGAQALTAQADLLVLGLLADPRTIGIYKVAVMVGIQVGFAAWIVNAVYAPQIVRLHRSDKHEELARLIRSGRRFVLLTALPIALVILLFGRNILVLVLGHEYEDAYWPMVIVACGQVFAASAGPVGILLGMTGHERDVAKVMGIASVFGIALMALLAGTFGAIGAAVATATTLVLTRVLLRRITVARFPSLSW